MKKLNGKKICSVILSMALTLTMIGSNMVFASDTLPYLGDSAKGTNQPYQHGYRSLDLKSWSAETDPYADYMRAQVPLQERNNALTATQANPELDPEVEMFTLAGDYGNAFFDSYSYTNEFSQYLFNYWQYADYYGSWHGQPTEEVPESLYQDERGVTDAWKNRKFEFGIINMPNPGYTNAAHKNGVKSIGCIFLPRTGQTHSPMLEQDESGNFIIADKLAEMCKWYGFDGYFINQEEGIPASDIPLYKAFMKQMRDEGVYIQWYDSVVNGSGSVSYQNEFNSSNSPFVKENDTQYSDSIFLNYWWNKSKLASSATHAISLGLNPLKSVFAGFEAGGDRWSQRYDMRNNVDDNGKLMNALASLGGEFVHDGLDEDLDGTNDNVAMRREKDEFQYMTIERERRWWSGPFEDPSKASFTADRSTYEQIPEIGITDQNFDGVAAYIAERSVINGKTFITNFNTGHGLEYNINGTISNAEEWSNINIQDILPTWQWWFTDSSLKADFDYGTKYTTNQEYSLVGGYNGGSSLVVYGNNTAENFLHLYKTDLDVTENGSMNITFKKSSDDAVAMKLGVIFEDDTNNVVKFDIDNSAAKSDKWITSTVDLSEYAGKKIAAFGLVFDGSAEGYQMNIGQMKYSNALNIVPETPTGFNIDKAYSTKEMTVSWDIASYDDVKQYNLYAIKDGQEIYLGGIYDDHYYIKNLEETLTAQLSQAITSVGVTTDKDSVKKGESIKASQEVKGISLAESEVLLKLTAVSEDGTESAATYKKYDYSKAAQDINVEATDGKLNVTWTGGQADVTVMKEYTDDETKYSVSGNNSATISVPSGKDADFARYTVQIKLANGEVATYDGRMDDSYCEPYSTTRIEPNGKLAEPSSKDWYTLSYKVVTDGVDGEATTITRSVNGMPSIPGSADGVKVTLTDYRGNVSNEVYVKNTMSITVSPAEQTVEASKTLQLSATAKNYETSNAVTWSVKDNTDTKTTIDENGLLTVGVDEMGTESWSGNYVTVVATSVENTKVTGTVTVKIKPAYAIASSTGKNAYKGETSQLSVQKLGVNQPASDYTWSVDSPYPDYYPISSGTKIDGTGLLTVASDETAYSLVVTATSKTNTNFKVTYDLSPKVAYAVTIENVYKGATNQFTATYKGEPTTATDFNWKVEATSGTLSSGTTIDENGLLTVAADETATRIKVTITKKTDENITASVTKNFAIAAQIIGNSPTIGATTQFTAKYLGVDQPATDYDWSVTGNGQAGTTIDTNGLLTVDAGEEMYTSVTIKATHKTNTSYTASKEVYLYPAGDTYSLSALNIDETSKEAILPASTVKTTNASFANGLLRSTTPVPMETVGKDVVPTTDVSQDVTWRLEGNTSENTVIDENGNITVAKDETATQLTVVATSVVDTSVSGNATVKVLEADKDSGTGDKDPTPAPPTAEEARNIALLLLLTAIAVCGLSSKTLLNKIKTK